MLTCQMSDVRCGQAAGHGQASRPAELCMSAESDVNGTTYVCCEANSPCAPGLTCSGYLAPEATRVHRFLCQSRPPCSHALLVLLEHGHTSVCISSACPRNTWLHAALQSLPALTGQPPLPPPGPQCTHHPARIGSWHPAPFMNTCTLGMLIRGRRTTLPLIVTSLDPAPVGSPHNARAAS